MNSRSKRLLSSNSKLSVLLWYPQTSTEKLSVLTEATVMTLLGAGVAQWQSVMMLSKNYGIFWVQTQPYTPELLEKKVLSLTTQCVYMT